MRLFFEDPRGQRLAIDTNRREWSANYTELPDDITNEHTFINVRQPDDLDAIEKEIDFNGWSYNNDLAEDRHAASRSVFTDYLRELERYMEDTDTGGTHSADEIDDLHGRIERAQQTGYFNARQYAALLLLLEELCGELEPYDTPDDDEAEPF